MCSPGRVDDEGLLHELREIRAPHPGHGLHNADVEDGGHRDATHVHDQQVADLRQNAESIGSVCAGILDSSLLKWTAQREQLN